MKKLNALLHDVSVVNFRVIAKLINRYRSLSVAGLVCFLILCPYLYFSQVVIHQKQVFFKVGLNSEGSPTNAITNLVEDAHEFFNKREIVSSINSHNFRTLLAKHLVASENFKSLDFTSTSKNSPDFAKALTLCKSDECKHNIVRDSAPSLYALDVEEGTDRFTLTVTTRSDVTTLEILMAFQKALGDVRYQNSFSEIENQISQISDLISKSRKEIEDIGGFAKIAASESLDSLITQQTNKINNIVERLNIESDQYNFQKIRLRESNITAHTDIHGAEKLNYEKFSKISGRIEELRQNIALVAATPAHARSSADESVLTQLRAELADHEKILRSVGDPKRNLAFEDSFKNTQINNQSTFAFDYKVTTAKVKSLQKEHEKAKDDLNELFSQKARMDNDLLTLKPDLEYLKQMETKLVALRMKKAAITSDVFFDNYGTDVSTFKRNSLVHITLFSFLLVSFGLFFFVILFYLKDDIIYDEFEIEKCCDDLPIIGQAPQFD